MSTLAWVVLGVGFMLWLKLAAIERRVADWRALWRELPGRLTAEEYHGVLEFQLTRAGRDLLEALRHFPESTAQLTQGDIRDAVCEALEKDRETQAKAARRSRVLMKVLARAEGKSVEEMERSLREEAEKGEWAEASQSFATSQQHTNTATTSDDTTAVSGPGEHRAE